MQEKNIKKRKKHKKTVSSCETASFLFYLNLLIPSFSQAK
jgi:hypothetical protein